jgi:hypothetical protein
MGGDCGILAQYRLVVRCFSGGRFSRAQPRLGEARAVVVSKISATRRSATNGANQVEMSGHAGVRVLSMNLDETKV